ncbi:hypothetical protein HUA74_35680 [Myxococcus sp. CA051A]|uniref:hypothetical protein n=1 Tax=unclassified Myxococcus TaxID=2648731 RepID=UPI00157A5D5E|nr:MULTISPECIES: hypothetical protein [unclassified Myxococcus]NTX10676.1 hypothetical protein [Myxococcus sp. CA056]NTX41378.1 hypothetical protein [Myxococcus sp. CA033]NTX50702.1 hypothetical protein [Myxococcus sp. CA039A]NTX66011.1 hypothetical protein [Myxococcus sp. CA051A]
MGNKGSGKTPSANDQRSDTKNPNNPSQKSAQDNRSNQMNPNHGGSKSPPSTTPGGTPGGNGRPDPSKNNH